jgi:predicted transcriptional regulator
MKQEKSIGTAKITRVQNEVNLPSDRFRVYLKDMNAIGLLEHRDGLASTKKGRSFVSEYKEVVRVLRRFGVH